MVVRPRKSRNTVVALFRNLAARSNIGTAMGSFPWSTPRLHLSLQLRRCWGRHLSTRCAFYSILSPNPPHPFEWWRCDLSWSLLAYRRTVFWGEIRSHGAPLGAKIAWFLVRHNKELPRRLQALDLLDGNGSSASIKIWCTAVDYISTRSNCVRYDICEEHWKICCQS